MKDITLSSNQKKQLLKEFMGELEPVLKELTDEILSRCLPVTYLPEPDLKTPFVKSYFAARRKKLNSATYKRNAAELNMIRVRRELTLDFDRVRQMLQAETHALDSNLPAAHN